MVNIMSQPWLSYCLFTKFFNPISSDNFSVPLVLGEKNEVTKIIMLNYEHLIRYDFG